uniref:Uncharacterized protein n=1 Tax=Manihot esculenta TaxID=3983 RepID=A0A199UC57_MANES
MTSQVGHHRSDTTPIDQVEQFHRSDTTPIEQVGWLLQVMELDDYFRR